MHIVSVINYKGGVGKTTLTANLAAELAWRDHKILMIDLDAQASLTFSFITPDDWQKNYADNRTIKSWFDSFDIGSPLPLAGIIFTPQRAASALRGRQGKLDLVASHLGLINVDLELVVSILRLSPPALGELRHSAWNSRAPTVRFDPLATKLGGANLTQAKRNFLAVHSMLANGLDKISGDTYDLILIDCPPNFNVVTKTAIVSSDYILVPARPDYLSTLGIDYLIRSTNTLISEYNEYAGLDTGNETDSIDPRILYVVFNMIQEYGGKPISTQRPFIAQTKRLSGVKVMEPYIKRNDTIFGDAPQYGVPTVLKGYNSGSHTSVVEGLEKVTDVFCAGIGL